jgi:hypothetical protein
MEVRLLLSQPKSNAGHHSIERSVWHGCSFSVGVCGSRRGLIDGRPASPAGRFGLSREEVNSWFYELHGSHGGVAQTAEQAIDNRQVASSILAATPNNSLRCSSMARERPSCKREDVGSTPIAAATNSLSGACSSAGRERPSSTRQVRGSTPLRLIQHLRAREAEW